MLEKIGLPAKPSLRGNNWVIDATNCQGCSSNFTFINRKHHCRRCGGLFCGSCTSQRMYLRGQGESPVRICEPCKTLEEAARFELRYGHRNKSRKGDSKSASNNEDDVITKVLGDSRNESFSSDKESLPSMQRATSASCSTNETEFDLESTTPEELRQRAVEEKKKYKVLKAEGKPEEALRAFKRGKELERQAGTLELELRKNRRKALSSTSANENTKIGDGKQPKQKDDLVSELRELGWSDLDLHDTDKKPISTTLEGELSTLLKEVSKKTNKPENDNLSIDRAEVVAIKKKALALKREGKLTEAKEELKRAKILEKQIEEKELLGDDEDSDDEFTSLIRSMDIDKKNVLASGSDQNRNFDFNLNHLLRMDDVPNLDGNFEVTDDDINDPEMSAALQSLGWTEDNHGVDKETLLSEIHNLKREALNKKRAGNTAEALALLKKAKLLEANADGTHETLEKNEKIDSDYKVAPKSKLVIQRELLALKKKALALRREGKVDEADQELIKGKALEQQLDELENSPKVKVKPEDMKHVDLSVPTDVEDEEDVTDTDMNDPSYLSLLQNLGWQDEDDEKVEVPKKPIVVSKKSKAEIQRELLALKRKSRALRHDGNIDEAEEVLKTTKGLEAQLAEMEAPDQNEDDNKAEVLKHPIVVSKKSKAEIQRELLTLKRKSLALRREGNVDEAEEVLKTTKGLEAQLAEMEAPDQNEDDNKAEVLKHQIVVSKKSKAEIQRELLTLKRKSLALRREGNVDEAEEVLKTTKGLEAQLAEMEAINQETDLANNEREKTVITEVFLAEKPQMGIKEEAFVHEKPQMGINEEAFVHEKPRVAENELNSVQQQILAYKRKAVSLKREGKLAEAKEELKQAKLLEKEKMNVHNKTLDLDAGYQTPVPSTSKVTKREETDDYPTPKLSSRERFKLQQESLSHKRKALKLRREGKHEEAEAEFELAKNLESQLEAATESTKPVGAVDDVSIEDLLDPQLLSALRDIGIEGGFVQSSPEKTEPVKTKPVVNKSQAELAVKAKPVVNRSETLKLEEQIKAEKVKALNLKRAGKQAEALDALRRAKALENKLHGLA